MSNLQYTCVSDGGILKKAVDAMRREGDSVVQIDTSLSKFEEVEKAQMERAEKDWISKERELIKKHERTHAMSNSPSESNDAEKKDVADFGRADVIDLEDRKAIERFKYLLKEYGLEFDENLSETTRPLKQAVLDALPPTMRRDAERITLIKDKCNDLRGILDSMYPVEMPDYARYSSLRDLVDDIEIYVEGGEPSRGSTVSEVEANAEGQDSATAAVSTDSREGA